MNFSLVAGWLGLSGFVLGLFVYLYKMILSVKYDLEVKIALKMDSNLCIQKYGEVKNRLDKNDEVLITITKKLDDLMIGLTKVNTTLEMLLNERLPHLK